MALLAHQAGVRASQLKICQVVVKSSWFPTSGLVAGSAVLAKFSQVNIILEMAQTTFSVLGFKISSCLLVEVTLLANKPLVFAFQLEQSPAVVKILVDGLQTIMTPNTIGAIVKAVRF